LFLLALIGWHTPCFAIPSCEQLSPCSLLCAATRIPPPRGAFFVSPLTG
jgi:hypothetical protein